MYFKNLPHDIKKEIEKLTKDEVFQKRFAEDQILDELDDQKLNMVEQYQSLQSIYNVEKNINDITLASWSYLWAIKNPITDFNKLKTQQISQFDLDIFYYVIQNDVRHINIQNLITEAAHYSSKVGLNSYDEAFYTAIMMIRRAFKPLSMFPATMGDGKEALFDAEWVTKSVGIVAEMTNFDANYIIHQLPLHSVCYYFVQYAKKSGDKQVHRRTPEEILIAQDERACELIVDYLAEIGKITADEKQYYYNIITTKP